MKKVLALVLSGIMACSLAGCGSAAETGEAASSAANAAVSEAAGVSASDVKAAADTASSVAGEAMSAAGEVSSDAQSAITAALSSSALSDGTLTVGTNAAVPPFEYIGDDGNPDGFDIALINAIGEKLGVKVEVQDMEFDSLVTSIGNKIDVAIAGMTVTDERKQQVSFSDPYYEAVQYVIVPADSTIATADDLKGLKLGCQLGTTGNFIIDEIDGATEQTYDKAIDAVNDLINGKLDAVIIDKNPAEVFVSKYSDKLKAIDGKDFDFDTEDYAIAMPKDDTVLQLGVNAALELLKTDGTYDKLVEQYIANYSAD